MSLEKDIVGIMESDIFKPASAEEVIVRNAEKLELLKGNKLEYLKKYPDTCPFCGSDDIGSTVDSEEHGHIDAALHCYTCDQEWLEEYTLSGFKPIAKED